MEALQRIGQLAGILQVLAQKIEAGDETASKLHAWVKTTSDQSMTALKEIHEIRKDRVEDSAQFVEMTELLEELEEAVSSNRKETIKAEMMRDLAHLFSVSAKVCRETPADTSNASARSELATVLMCISEAMQKRSNG